MKPIIAHVKAEILMTLSRGESLLLIIGIPVLLLGFFSMVDVLPIDDTKSVNYLLPGIIALAILSTGFTSTAISTAFERQYAVLKRVGLSPLGRTRLIVAKIAAVLVIEILQVLTLLCVGLLLGWRLRELSGLLSMTGAIGIATAAFVGLAMTFAGRLRAEVVLAGANGIYVLLLLTSGVIFSADKLPKPMQAITELQPLSALSIILRDAIGSNDASAAGLQPWLVLAAWAIGLTIVAAKSFRFDPS